MMKLWSLLILCFVHIPTWHAWRCLQTVVVKRNLQQVRAINQQDQKDAILINSLVNKLVEGVQAALKSNNSSQTPPKPFKLHFKARHKSKFDLPESSKAIKYLSLPLNNYSALDTKFVKLKADEEQHVDDGAREQSFTLSLPLFDMTSALSFPIDATLTTDISVVPNTANGKIHMYSGPVYFIHENAANKRITNTVQHSLSPVAAEQEPGKSTNTKEEKTSFDRLEEKLTYEENVSLKRFMKEKKEITSQIPSWLIWGGNLNGKEGTVNVDGYVVPNGTSVKSSIQASIKIDMVWNQNDDNRRVFETLFGNRGDSEIENSNETLPVESVVQVSVDLNLPVKGHAAFVLGLLPLRVVIAQIGSLLAKTIMRSLSPVFVDALIRDYMRRKDLLT